jgi:hypothetical protein
MPISTTEREKCLTDAIDHFHAHNGSISIRKVTLQFQVSHITLRLQIQGKQGTIASNGGQNKLLADAQLVAVFLYI